MAPGEEVLYCVVNLLLTKKSLDPFHIFTGTSMQDASGVGASVSSVERRPLFASEAHRAVPRLLCHSAEITRSSALPLSRSRSRQTPSPSEEKLPEQGVRVAPAKARRNPSGSGPETPERTGQLRSPNSTEVT